MVSNSPAPEGLAKIPSNMPTIDPTWPSTEDLAASSSPKYCFVTVGATASFDELIFAVLNASFLTALKQRGFTHLLLQYGSDGKVILDDALSSGAAKASGLTIEGFDFRKEGLDTEMRLAKAEDGRRAGLLICHAGSGTVLDAIRMNLTTIVVPNTSLLHNHQVELADAFSKLGWVVHGTVDNLEKGLSQADTLATKRNTPRSLSSTVTDGQESAKSKAEKGGLPYILEREVGFFVD